MKQKTTRKGGFTLLELLIVVSIIALLTVYGVGNFTNTTKELQFSGFVNELTSEIRKARAESLTGKIVPDYTDFDEDQIAHPLSDGTCAEITIKKGYKYDQPPEGCSEEELIVAAGVGMAFVEDNGVKKIYFFTDLHNDGEGSFDLTKSLAAEPDYLSDADSIEISKTIDFSVSPYDEFEMLLSNQPDANFSDAYFIYQPPFGDMVLSNNGTEMYIWLTRKEQGFTDNTRSYGKIIRVGKISGIPEVFNAGDIIK